MFDMLLVRGTTVKEKYIGLRELPRPRLSPLRVPSAVGPPFERPVDAYRRK